MKPATPPARPARFADYPAAILTYLNAGGADYGSLLTLLRGWGALHWSIPNPNRTDAANVVIYDLDGDGQVEVVVAIVPAGECCDPPGMLLVYARVGASYRLAQQIGSADSSVSALPFMSPHILGVRDLTGDGTLELVFTSWLCGAHTCYADVNIARWNGSQLVPLLAKPANMADPQIRLAESGHGTMDLVMHGGVIGSAGAGTQRARTDVYHWNGDKFALFSSTLDASNLLYFKVVDANAEFAAGRYAAAIALYREAIQNPRLTTSGDWRGVPTEREDLLAFARFRLGVAYLLMGDPQQAQGAFAELLAQQPAHAYAEVVRRFQAAYTPRRSVADGCAAVTQLARADERVPGVLNGFGYANPDIAPEDVCAVR